MKAYGRSRSNGENILNFDYRCKVSGQKTRNNSVERAGLKSSWVQIDFRGARKVKHRNLKNWNI
jgi:hypothetical protein